MRTISSLVAALSMTAGVASAASLTVEDGQLTGATGVDVGGVLYDGTFIDGTCIAVFDGCDAASDLNFQTEAQARLAVQALLDQAFVNGPEGAFDDDPSISSSSVGAAFVPFLFEAGSYDPILDVTTAASVNVIQASNRDPSFPDNIFQRVRVQADRDLGGQESFVYAKFTAQVAEVPVPASLPALALGLGALGWIGRRR